MPNWLIYGIISCVIVLLILCWTIARKSYLIKRIGGRVLSWRVSFSIVVILALCVSLLPSVLWWNNDRVEYNGVLAGFTDAGNSFVNKYGKETDLRWIEKPNDVYIAYYIEDGVTKVVALINSSDALGTVWVDIGTLETEPPAEE